MYGIHRQGLDDLRSRASSTAYGCTDPGTFAATGDRAND
jgi:hypothetical protein